VRGDGILIIISINVSSITISVVSLGGKSGPALGGT